MRKIDQKRKDELKKKAKIVNDSLYRLEKAGLQQESRMYQQVNKYAVDKQSSIYNVNLDKGTIRVTTDLSRFTTAKDLRHYEEVLDNLVDAETRTVTGTKKAQKKAYDKIVEKMRIRPGSVKQEEFSFEKYKQLWKIYKNNVKSDRAEKIGSDTVFNLITSNKQFYDMSEEDVAQAFSYFTKYTDKDVALDNIEAMLEGVEELN